MPRRRPRQRRPRPLPALAAAVLLLAAVLAFRWLNGEDFPPQTPAAPAVSQSSQAQAEQEPAPGLEVYFLDVGQGDSALIRHTGKNGVWTMLIDTGEYAYADGLINYLQSLGVEKLDALVCSHPHTDHMGCMARVVRRFKPAAFYMPQVPEDMLPTTSAYEALLDAVNESEDPTIMALHQSTVISCPESLTIDVLAPRPDADWEDLNNWSAVLRLSYGDVSFLFTGDAEKQSEKLILEDAPACGWDLETTVLKCGHHGSSTSSTAKFLKAVLPEYAVISCGKDNPYGHPHKETLKKLDKLGTKIYRTDESGTVLAKTDGSSIAWETGLPSIPAREWD